MKTTEEKIAELSVQIDDEIHTGKIDSLKSILKRCKELARENNFDIGSFHWLSSLAYGAYIIHCETKEIVPKSGY